VSEREQRNQLTISLTHSLTHSLSLPLTHSLTISLTISLTHSLTDLALLGLALAWVSFGFVWFVSFGLGGGGREGGWRME